MPVEQEAIDALYTFARNHATQRGFDIGAQVVPGPRQIAFSRFVWTIPPPMEIIADVRQLLADAMDKHFATQPQRPPDNGIAVCDPQPFEGLIFRVARFERGACVDDLWCRVELIPAGGFGLAFFGRNAKRNAEHNDKPLSYVPAHQADLAKLAFEKLQQLQEARDKGRLVTGIPF